MAIEVSRSDRLERLRAQLRGGPVSSKRAGQTPSSRGANLLFGVLLHGAARLEAGLELTDWETRLLAPVRELVPDEEVRDFGRLYQEEQASRAKVFPDTFSARPLEAGYTLEDVFAELPGVYEEIAAQPNVNVVDLDTRADDARDSKEFTEGMAAYGYGATVVTSSAQEPAPQSAKPVRVKVWLDKFHMYSGSDEFGSEEIYWAMASGADGGNQQAIRSRTYTDMWSGKTRDIEPNTVVYHGAVDKVLTYNIQCWEEDHGAPAEFARTMDRLAQMAWETAEALGEFPAGTHLEATQAFVGFIAGIASLIKHILDFIYDDLVAQRTITFDRRALESMAGKPYDEKWWTFNGGWFDGNHHLLVRTHVGKLPSLAVRSLSGTAWSTPVQPPATHTPSAPALASFGDHLYMAHEGIDKSLYISRFDGTSWSPHQKVHPYPGLSAPALAVHGGRLHLAHRGLDNGVYTISSPDGVTWSSLVRLPGETQDGPALALNGPDLHCAFRGVNNDQIYSCVLRNGTWHRALDPHPSMRTHYGPALTQVGSAPFMVHTGLNRAVFIAYRMYNDVWSEPTNIGATVTAAPALAEVTGGDLGCAVQGMDGVIWHNRQNRNKWGGFQQVPNTGNAVSAPALTLHRGVHYLAYATATPGL
ncbi:hypothetical protein [Streptomyces sp. NBC_01276]|uniref:hypothetical protein n=1 Tax=Streptomyces sp. NBC_01276 TaxID=2903808 RepID=UPI002F90ECA4